MAKKPTHEGPLVMLPQSGADLREWRLAVGLLAREAAELIGVSERTVLRAERSAEPQGKVLTGFERLQIRFVEGKLDVCRIIRRRGSQRGRARTMTKTQTTGHSPRKTARKDRTMG